MKTCVFLILLLDVSFGTFQSCKILNSTQVCDCTTTYDIMICANRHLSEMPRFSVEVSKRIETFHMEYNLVLKWPSDEFYWDHFPLLQNLEMEFNPVCRAPTNLPPQVKIVLSECKLSEYPVFTLKNNVKNVKFDKNKVGFYYGFVLAASASPLVPTSSLKPTEEPSFNEGKWHGCVSQKFWLVLNLMCEDVIKCKFRSTQVNSTDVFHRNFGWWSILCVEMS